MVDVKNPASSANLDESSFGAGDVVAEYKIRVTRSAGLAIYGPLEEKEFTLAVLANAADAVRNHHARKEGGLIVPSKDITISLVE